MPRRLTALAAGACVAAITLAVVTTGGNPAVPGGAAATPVPAASVPAASLPAASVPAPAVSAPAPAVSAAAAAVSAPTGPPPTATPAAAALLGAEAPAGPAAAAAAVLAVRITSGPSLYVDTAVADGVTSVAGITIVGVRALVLHRAGDRWTRPTLMRYAVPVGVRASSVTHLARPWRLPAPVAPRAALPTVPLRDAELLQSATAAIVAAGYEGVRDVRLGRAAAVPGIVVAAVRATGPGDSEDGLHRLWLTADAARVVGMPSTLELPAQQEHP